MTEKINNLVLDDKNFNKGTEYGEKLIEKSFEKFGAGRSILLDKNNRIIAGNKSVLNAIKTGMQNVEIIESDGKKLIAVKRTDIDLDTIEGRELALADNATAKANIDFDMDMIKQVSDELNFDFEASDLGIDFDLLGYGDSGNDEGGESNEGDDTVYNRKIEAPIYEPRRECPAIIDLLNTDKAKSLINEIKRSKASDEIKEFLINAAYRHNVFNYELIAEYYAHADKETQELFEKSALVIIDFDKAIENGFVRMSVKMGEFYNEDYGNEE